MIKKFSIPSWYIHHEYMMAFLKYYNENRSLFYSDRVIDSVYDAYNYSNIPILWAGGRYSVSDNPTIPMFKILDNFKQYPNIEIRHVFTNTLLDNDALINDYTCNKFVKQCIRHNDGVTLNHPKLIEHFKTNYPHIKIVYSTTINAIDIDKVNELSQNNIYVMNYNYNNNNEYLNKLKYKSNIEILCAEPCNPFCPNRLEHYNNINDHILNSYGLKNDSKPFTCPFGAEPFTFSEIMQRPHAITNERIDKLSEQGFQYFKISGRTVPIPQWIQTIIYYLAKPENYQYIVEKLITEWWCHLQAINPKI